MGKSTISMVIFNSYVTNYQRVGTSNMVGTSNLGSWNGHVSEKLWLSWFDYELSKLSH